MILCNLKAVIFTFLDLYSFDSTRLTYLYGSICAPFPHWQPSPCPHSPLILMRWEVGNFNTVIYKWIHPGYFISNGSKGIRSSKWNRSNGSKVTPYLFYKHKWSNLINNFIKKTRIIFDMSISYKKVQLNPTRHVSQKLHLWHVSLLQTQTFINRDKCNKWCGYIS